MTIRLVLLLSLLFSFGIVFESCTSAPKPKSNSGGGDSHEDHDEDEHGSGGSGGSTQKSVYYDPDIKEMMNDKCDKCHTGAGSEDPLMESYSETKNNANIILEQLESGEMPKEGSSLRSASLFSDEDEDEDEHADEDEDEHADEDEDEHDDSMSDAEMVEAWMDAGMPESVLSTGSTGTEEVDPILQSDDFNACHARGKLYNRSWIKQCSDQCAAIQDEADKTTCEDSCKTEKVCDNLSTFPASFSCDSVESLKNALSGTYPILFAGSGDVTGIDQLVSDGYSNIDQCGEVGGKPVVWLYKKSESSYSFKRRSVQ